MCDKGKSESKCQQPEKLKGGDPRKCSPEQIRKCHGDVKKHPCVKPDKQ